MSSKITLPNGWEKCRTGKRDVRKWRNMRTGCWVTDRVGDPIIHAGIHNTPVKYDRAHHTAQSVLNEIEAVTSDYEKKTEVVVDFSGCKCPACIAASEAN